MELVVETLIVKVPPGFVWTPESKPPSVLQGSFKRAVAYAMLNDCVSRKGWSTDLRDRVISCIECEDYQIVDGAENGSGGERALIHCDGNCSCRDKRRQDGES